MFKKLSLPFVAFLQATGLVVYILILDLFFNFMGTHFVKAPGAFYGPLMMLLLFVISAVISGLLVLGKAGYLFWEKRYKQSFTLLGWTVGWGLFYFALLVTALLTQAK
jgi:hypothetical protein